MESIWLWRGEVRADGRDHMLPTGTAGLIVNLGEDEVRIYEPRSLALNLRTEGTAFMGTQGRAFAIDTAEQAFVAGVSFLPGGAWPFTADAQDALANLHVPARDAWGTTSASLRDRLLCARSPAAMLDTLERILADQLCRPPELHPAVAVALCHIAQDPAQVRITRLQPHTALGNRRLSRLFELQVGMTPKRYARLLRFRRVLEAVHGAAMVDWTAVALRCGYYDQPHFNRDFKEFSGFTPSDYFAHRGEFLNHVPVQ